MSAKPPPLLDAELSSRLNGAASLRAVPGGLPYGSSLEHILAELERIDLLIEAQIRRARQSQEQDSLRGLYISEQEVDLLMARPMGMPYWAAVPLAAGGADAGAALAQM